MNDKVTDELCVETVFQELNKRMFEDSVIRDCETCAQQRVSEMIECLLIDKGVDTESERGMECVQKVLGMLGRCDYPSEANKVPVITKSVIHTFVQVLLRTTLYKPASRVTESS